MLTRYRSSCQKVSFKDPKTKEKHRPVVMQLPRNENNPPKDQNCHMDRPADVRIIDSAAGHLSSISGKCIV